MSDLFSPVSVLSKLSLQKAQRNLDDSKSFLFNDFRGISKILSLYNPLEVMKMSLWEERRVYAVALKDEVKRRASVLLPIVLQSIVESDMMEGVGNSREVKEKDWERLKSLSEDIVRRMVRIIDSMTSIAINKGNVDLNNADALRKSIEKRLLPDFVDKETQDRDVWQLRSLFEEIPDFESRMGCDYISFVLNVQNIARVGLNGIDNLVRDVTLYKEEYSLSEAQMRSSGELDGLNDSQIFDKITKKNHWEGRAASLTERRDGFSLFMPEISSSLPLDSYAQYSVKAFSLDIETFLSRGFWPSVRYPFFEYEGKMYTFVGKHLPFFLSLSSLVDRFLASSRDVLSIFFLSDCDTYTYDGNKIEISVLPSVLDVNPVLHPASFRNIMDRRKSEISVQRKLGHKKLVVDPDMEEEMEKKDDVLYISASFLSRATVDKNTKRDLLSSLLGDLELPEEDTVFSDIDEYVDTTESPADDFDDKSSYDYEYEYNDTDEDELAKEIDERYDNITLVEYDKTTPTEEEKKNLIDRYSLTDEIIKKSEEDEKLEAKIEDALDDDIFDDSEEEEHLDDIGCPDEESEYFEEVEGADDYIEEEEKTPNDGQLDFLSLLDEEDPEEIEFDNELDEEEEESFEEEEKREEVLDSDILLPNDDEETVEEISKVTTDPLLEDSDTSEEALNTDSEDKTGDHETVEETREASLEQPLEEPETLDETLGNDDSDVKEEERILPSEDEPVEDVAESISEPLRDEPETLDETLCCDEEVSEEIIEEGTPENIDEPKEYVMVDEDTTGVLLFDEPAEKKDTTDSLDDKEEEAEGSSPEVLKEETAPFFIPQSDDSEEEIAPEGQEEVEEPNGKVDEEKTPSVNHEPEPEPTENNEENKKPSMSFTDSLFAALGMDEEEDDEEVKEEEHPLETAVEEESSPAIEEESAPTLDEEIVRKAEIPGVIGEIYKILGSSSAFGQFIELSDEDTLSDLDEVIENCWKRQQVEGKDKMFNIPDYSLSIILAHDSVRDDLRLSELLNNAGGVMYSRDSECWNAVIVYIDPEYTVEKAIEKMISRSTFSPSDWKRVTYIGEQMKKR
ncbi:MAG: hypothetical protein MR687_05710 [Spirochaetales bacterium]|nr:hypothetical protein [Spirochaetales bacterium]